MTRTSCIGKPAIGPAFEHLLDALLHGGMNVLGIAPPFT